MKSTCQNFWRAAQFNASALTWGEGCIQDIKFFIDLFKEHLDNDYYKFNAQEKMEYFEEVLSRLKESSWMNQ